MKTFSFRHEFDCDVSTFWSVFFDERVNREGFTKVLKFAFWEVLAFEKTEASIRRVIRAGPPLDRVPLPVARLMGGMTYTEAGTLDRASGVFRFTSTPSVMGDRIRLGGDIRVSPIGRGRVEQTVDMFVDAQVVGLGRLLEQVAIKDTIKNFDGLAEHQNGVAAEWMRGNEKGAEA